LSVAAAGAKISVSMKHWNDLRVRLRAWQEGLERAAAAEERRAMDPSFWAELDAVDWASYDLPIDEYHNGYYDVPEALEWLVNSHGNRSGALWNALGCDYCGVCYPAVVPATPLLVRIALEGPKWPRVSALEFLADAASCMVGAKSEARRTLERSRGPLAGLAADASQPDRVREAANDLLDLWT
jgi:hypothetical protein